MDALMWAWETPVGFTPPQDRYQPGSQLQSSWVPTAAPHVVVVDDDSDLLDLLLLVFESDGFRVIPCRTLQDAITAFEREPVDLVVTDARLRDHSEFLVPRWLDEHRPPLRGIIILTGVTASTLRQHEALIQRLDARIVTKPFEVDGLLGVARALADWPGVA